MKNILRIGLSIVFVGSFVIANAQSLPNYGFENWKGSGNAGYSIQTSNGSLDGGSSVLGPRQRPGDEPTSWNGSSVNQKVFISASKELIFKDGSSDNYYAKLQNLYIGVGSFGSNAPAYLTFGTPWVYAISTVSKCDGGTFGSMEFTYKPDAITLSYMKTMSSDGNENSYMVAYIWNGTFTSDVTASATYNVEDADHAVLGSQSETGISAPTSNYDKSNGNLIAWCNETFATSATSTWTTIEFPLSYISANKDLTPSKINVIISAGDYWNRSNIQANTILYLDNVNAVYWNTLSSLVYDGEELLEDSETDYKVDDYYNASKLSYKAKSIFGEVSPSYDATTGLLTLTVSRANADNKVYTIQFKPCAASMSINSSAQYATFVAPFDVAVPSGVTAYTVSGYEGGSATLNMTEVSGTISANTPVILYSESGLNETNVYGINSATGTSVTSGLLTGVYSDYQTTGGEYVLQNQSGKVAFYKVDASVARPWVRANRCYIPASASSAKMLNLNNDATAISTLSALTSGEYESIYSASGAKQNSLQKGVNILKMNDGTTRKVLVK